MQKSVFVALSVLLASCGGGGSSGTGTFDTIDEAVTPAEMVPAEIEESLPDTDSVDLPEAEPEPIAVADEQAEEEAEPATEPELTPAPPQEPAPEQEPVSAPPQASTIPDSILSTDFEGVTAVLLNFPISPTGRLGADALFQNNTNDRLDARCDIDIFNGNTEVASTFISVDDLEPGESVPAETLFLESSLDLDSFDTAQFSGCFASEARPPAQQTPDPDFPFVDRAAFEDVEVFVLEFDFNQFGDFIVNSLVESSRDDVADVQCRLNLFSGNFVVGLAIVGVDDLSPGDSVPDQSEFFQDGIDQDSFDRARLADCSVL